MMRKKKTAKRSLKSARPGQMIEKQDLDVPREWGSREYSGVIILQRGNHTIRNRNTQSSAYIKLICFFDFVDSLQLTR